MSDTLQSAPYPAELDRIVRRLRYRPGWRVVLEDIDRGQGSKGLTLCVYTRGFDTYHVDRGENYRVRHPFPVPPAAYNAQSWQRWVLDRLIEVETHEACEFFALVDEDGGGEARPFAPNHGPGWDPYAIRELNTVEAAETTFRGERREGTQG